MTATKPPLDPAKLKPSSGRTRMTIDYPIKVSKRPGSVEAKYNPAQKRDPSGEWGDGIPGNLPRVDIAGSFGRLSMQADDSGDVHLVLPGDRELDIAVHDLAELADHVESLSGERDAAVDGADSDEVLNSVHFGAESEHLVELHGNGVITVRFRIDDPPAWELDLDPPDEDGDDVQAFLDAADDILPAD